MKIEAGLLDTIVGGAKNLVASDIKGVTIGSAYTPPLTYTGQQLIQIANEPRDPNAPSTLIGSIVKPTITIDSSMAGRYTLAPYGSADPNSWRRNQLILGLTIGVTALVLWAVGFKMGRGIGK